MSGSASTSPVLGFDIFQLDLRAWELRKQGVKLRLQGQPLLVLAALLRRAGEMMTREELKMELWSADTFVDFDHGLHNAIARIREALGDSAQNPRYIETLPRRGYRFIGEVIQVVGESAKLNDADAHLAEADGGELVVPGDRRVSAPLTTGAGRPRDSRRDAGATVRRLDAGVGENSPRSRWRIAFTRPIVAFAALFAAGGLLSIGRTLIFFSSPTEEVRSLAVLPMENLSGDPTQDCFVDGLTDELITDLAKVSSVRVISRTSVMRYKGTKKGLPEIARELKVDAVVEGSVLRSGKRVRITAQLLHAPSDRHLWAERYERDFGDELSLQREVALAIAQQVEAQVGPQGPSSSQLSARNTGSRLWPVWPIFPLQN